MPNAVDGTRPATAFALSDERSTGPASSRCGTDQHRQATPHDAALGSIGSVQVDARDGMGDEEVRRSALRVDRLAGDPVSRSGTCPRGVGGEVQLE